MPNIDFEALDTYLDRRYPVHQSIATVVSGSGDKAWVKPLGSGGKPIEVRVAINTALSSGDEVYMIRSKWQPDWIILTNLGKVGARSNIQNATPIHNQGTAKPGNVSSVIYAVAGGTVALTVAGVEIMSKQHNAKTNTLMLSGNWQSVATSGSPNISLNVYIDGVNKFPEGAPYQVGVIGVSMFHTFAIPVPNVEPGTRSISIQAAISSGNHAGRGLALHVVDI